MEAENVRRWRLGAAVLLSLALALPGSGGAQSAWPAPLAVAQAFAERYPQTSTVSYVSALSWRGALRIADLTGDPAWRLRARSGMQPVLEGPPLEGDAPLRLTSLAGYAAAADLGRIEGDEAALAPARAAAALLMSGNGRHLTGWTDDMFMASTLLSSIAGEGEPDRRAYLGVLLTEYVDRLQRSDGLFVHAEDAPHAWGRGNGFAALGLGEALAHLPEGAPERAGLLLAFRRQMMALVAHQSDDGSWRQVVDEQASYQELSVTAMVVAAMARGVRMGWLERSTFEPVLNRGWSAVLARIGPDGSVRDVCTSTAAGPTLAHYLERPAVSGLDDRGGGLVLTAAVEMAELGLTTGSTAPRR